MKYGLIGGKLSHSFSKPIHQKIADYTYEIKEIKKEELDSFMRKKDFLGINVTIPYKSDVIPYLDYIDPVAEKIGAVNTVVNRSGKLYGYNTDFSGLRTLTVKNGFDYKNKKVLIFGTGGTAKTAEAVAESLGAGKIIKAGRTSEINYGNVYTLHGDADFIINTTPVGMYPDNEGCIADLTQFSRLQGVTDVVYNPLKTRLCQSADALGIKNSTGLYMLIYQAVLAVEYFTDEKLNKEKTADEIFKEMLFQKRNIVLIGMPGCGKSTVGKALAQKLGKQFVDTDEMIVSKHGNISDIFENKGEKYFRDIETEQIKIAAKMNGTVIATGGGAVLRKENVDALSQNGVIIFLNRPIEQIVPTSDRPLSSDLESLKKRFEERYDIYVSCADKKIFVDTDVDGIVKKITEAIR